MRVQGSGFRVQGVAWGCRGFRRGPEEVEAGGEGVFDGRGGKLLGEVVDHGRREVVVDFALQLSSGPARRRGSQ